MEYGEAGRVKGEVEETLVSNLGGCQNLDSCRRAPPGDRLLSWEQGQWRRAPLKQLE